MDKYLELGYDKFMRKIGSIPNTAKPVPTAYEFDTQYEVRQKKVISSSVNVTNFISNSQNGTVSGSFADNTSVSVTTTLNPSNLHKNQKVFGQPYLEIYQGTAAVGSLKIYPNSGSGIANNSYSIHAGFDHATFDGLNSPFKVNVENNTGTTQNIYAVAQWKLLFYNNDSGTAS